MSWAGCSRWIAIAMVLATAAAIGAGSARAQLVPRPELGAPPGPDLARPSLTAPGPTDQPPPPSPAPSTDVTSVAPPPTEPDTAPAPEAAAPAESSAPTQLATAGPTPQRTQALSGGVAALVNDDVISTYDLRQRAILLMVTSGVAPTAQNMPQIQQEALRSLIDEHLQMQELRRMEKTQKFDIVASDKEVDQALSTLARQNNSDVNTLAEQFAKVGLQLKTLKEQIRVQISWQRMIDGRYGSRVRIGDDQVNQAMRRLEAAAGEPHYLVSEIFIDAARAGGMSQAVDGARQLITQIEQGAPFAPVARQFSNAPSAASGGDKGWVLAAELPNEVAKAVEEMRPGQLSEPIPVSDGVYIVQLRDKRAGGGVMTVSLKQAAVRLAADAPADEVEQARKSLESFAGSGATCADLEAKAASYDGVVASDLGESSVEDLSPEFRQPAETLALNTFSQPVRTSVGLHLLMVCDRKSSQAKLPNKKEIENRLFEEQLAMLSRRYLRDLRNSATIDTP